MKKWSQDGNVFSLTDVTTHLDNGLPVGVYKLSNSIFGLFLTRIADSFEIGHKVYGMETGLINRVVKTYQKTDTNLGILLNGLKGTGKTVTSKLICNALSMPIVLIDETFDERNIPQYLNSIDQPCIVFIDEYEKIFGKEADLLTIMDGAMSGSNRKVFILTTNDTYINENLIQRPGRIRYFKTYRDLPQNVINEVIDDLLEYKEYREDLIQFVSSLEIITIDVLKAIIQEVNIHNESPTVFKDVFNVKKMSGKFNVFEQVIDKEGNITSENQVHIGVKISPKNFDQYSVHDNMYINGSYFGEITDVLSFDTVIVQPTWDEENKKAKKPDLVTLRFEPYDSLHRSFQFGTMSKQFAM